MIEQYSTLLWLQSVFHCDSFIRGLYTKYIGPWFIYWEGGAVVTNGSRSRLHKHRARHSGIQLIREIGRLTNLRSSSGFNFTIWVNFTRCRDEIYTGRIIMKFGFFNLSCFAKDWWNVELAHCYMCQMLCITVD